MALEVLGMVPTTHRVHGPVNDEAAALCAFAASRARHACLAKRLAGDEPKREFVDAPAAGIATEALVMELRMESQRPNEPLAWQERKPTDLADPNALQ